MSSPEIRFLLRKLNTFPAFTIERFNYSLQAIFFVSNFEYYSTARYYVRDAKIQATLNLASRAHRL